MAFFYKSAFMVNENDPDLSMENKKMTEVLTNLSIDVFEIDPKGINLNVNDVAFILNGIALICSQNSINSQKAINLMRSALRHHVAIRTMELPVGAELKGGDVLFTGQEIIVGLTNETNEAGAQIVANTFPEYSTSAIKVPECFKSLRHAIAVFGRNVLAVCDNAESKKLLVDLSEVSSYRYQIIYLKEKEAVDALFVNGHLLTHSPVDIPESSSILESKMNEKPISLSFSKHLYNGFHMVDRVLPVYPAGIQKNIASTLP